MFITVRIGIKGFNPFGSKTICKTRKKVLSEKYCHLLELSKRKCSKML